jgi:hypothetical protein
MIKKHMKKCSISLVIKEMQIRTRLKFYLLLFKRLSSKTQRTTNMVKDVGKRKPSYTVGGTINEYSHAGKTIWMLLKEQKIELPYDSSIPLLGTYPKECK